MAGSGSFRVQCACGEKLTAPAGSEGKKARCPGCGATLTIQRPSAEPASVAPKVAAPKVAKELTPAAAAPPAQPASSGEDSFDALYELADYETSNVPEPTTARVTSVPSEPRAQRAPASPAVLGYRSATPAAKVEGLDTDKLTKQTVPLVILVGGLIVEAVLAHLRYNNPEAVMVGLVFGVGVLTVLMTIGVLIVARMRQLQIGSIWSVAMRVAAISVGTSALNDAVQPYALMFLCVGGIALLLVNFAIYFALLGMFFDLDQSDTWACVWVIFLVKVAVVLAAFGLMGALLHR